MKALKLTIVLSIFLLQFTFAQENEIPEKSNIQNYTPSKLLENGKWDIKWFNNLYTQTKAEADRTTVDVPRSNFFTTSLEVFTGITDNKKVNVGVIIDYRSNTIDENALSVFQFDNISGQARNGFSHFAPSVKIAPFNKLTNFSFQSSFFIPLFEEESVDGVFLGPKSYIWQNRFFYDYTFPGNKFQLFTELGTRFFFGDKEEGYANNSLELAPGVFFSYFPTRNFTLLTFVQHAQLIDLGNDFSQNYTALGLGAKYQLTQVLNLEVLYSNFVRGTKSGLGESFNLGLRAIF